MTQLIEWATCIIIVWIFVILFMFLGILLTAVAPIGGLLVSLHGTWELLTSPFKSYP